MNTSIARMFFPLCLAFAGTSWAIQGVVDHPPRRGLNQDVADRTMLIDDVTADDAVSILVMFDGTTLDGWIGEEGLWSIEDGAITGQTSEENPLKENSFLVWRGDLPENFDLALEFRVDSGNSGIQIRSEEIEPFRVKGYQADIDGTMQHMGILYEERGRGILCRRGQRVSIAKDGTRTEPESTGLVDEDFQAAYEDIEWHRYHITANGPQITFQIDDQITVQLNDQQEDASRRNGIIGLQLHVGPPMKIQFRNIVLKPVGVSIAENGGTADSSPPDLAGANEMPDHGVVPGQSCCMPANCHYPGGSRLSGRLTANGRCPCRFPAVNRRWLGRR